MQEYIINVSEIEELQMVSNHMALEQIFERAKRTVVHGSSVILVRKSPDGSVTKFDELTSEDAVDQYKKAVFKYL